MSVKYTCYFSSSFHFSEYHQQNISKVTLSFVLIQCKRDCALQPGVPHNMCNINYEYFCYYKKTNFSSVQFCPLKKKIIFVYICFVRVYGLNTDNGTRKICNSCYTSVVLVCKNIQYLLCTP
jgi:hypothetical protein